MCTFEKHQNILKVEIHPHALQRIGERGSSVDEVKETVLHGEKFSAKFGRTGFRKNFSFEGKWNNRMFRNKQIEVYCVKEKN